MRLTLKQTLNNVTVSVPIFVTYHQMTGPEIAAQQKPAQVALVASPEAAQVAKPVNAGPTESKELPAGITVPKVAATPPPALAKPQTASPTLLDPTDEFVLPQAALDEQGQLLSDEALKPVMQLLREPLGGAAMDAESKLDVGTVVVAKKPGAGDRLAAIREAHEDGKFVVAFLGDKIEPIAATRADLKRPPEQIARFVSASAFAIRSKTELRRGMLLETERSGNRWRPVIVLDVLGNGKVKIHYFGWASSWDSEVERSKLRFPTGVSTDR